MKETQKQLWQEIERRYIAENGKTDNYYKFLTKHYSTLLRLSNGEIVGIEKTKIKTNFCFGYGFCGISSDEEENAAARMAVRAEQDKNYFIEKNIEPLDKQIEELQSDRNIALYWGGVDVGSVGAMDKWDERLEFCNGQPLTDEDRSAYIEALQEEKAAFIKRLQAYLKRFGLSKIKSWSYLCD